MKILNFVLFALFFTTLSFGVEEVDINELVEIFPTEPIIKSSLFSAAIVVAAELALGKESSQLWNMLTLYGLTSIFYNKIYDNSPEFKINNAVNMLKQSISKQDLKILNLSEKDLSEFLNKLKNNPKEFHEIKSRMEYVKLILEVIEKTISPLEDNSSGKIKNSAKKILNFCSNTKYLSEKVLKAFSNYSTSISKT